MKIYTRITDTMYACGNYIITKEGLLYKQDKNGIHLCDNENKKQELYELCFTNNNEVKNGKNTKDPAGGADKAVRKKSTKK